MPIEDLPPAVVRMAWDHHALISTADLRREGVTRKAQATLVAKGTLSRQYRGLLAVTALKDPFTRLAADQARYPQLVAKADTAAAVWTMDVFRATRPLSRLDLVRPPGRTAKGVAARVAALPEWAVTTHNGIRVTTPAFTLAELELAGATIDELELALESAIRDGLTTDAELRAITDRPVLAAALARRSPHAPPTGSYAETRFLQRVVRPAGLEDPSRQVSMIVPGRPAPYVCDFVFARAPSLDVEVDGAATHWTPDGQEHDHVRDRALATLGIEVSRFAARRIERAAFVTRGELLRDLARASQN